MTELKRTFDAIKSELAYWQGEKDSGDELQADYARWEIAERMEILDRITIVSEYVRKYEGYTKD
tara:strand:- start:231 stop:422 length:192 start_codon:yes stop_codon:yes gene_type:complete